MKKSLYIIILVSSFFLFGCNEDDKPALTIIEEVEYGTVIRTLDFNNGEFEVNVPNSLFSVNIEEQDKERGGLFAGLDVYVKFIDNTLEGADLSTQEVMLETIDPDTFVFNSGPERLPRRTLEYTFQELADATGVTVPQVACKDQFVLRLDLRLTNGFAFTETDAVAAILAFDTFFSSPYTYTINVIEPIEEDSFTGDYLFESIVDGPLGPTFITPMPARIMKGHSNNVRRVLLWHVLSHKELEADRFYNFTIACDEVVMGPYQLSTVEGNCIQGAGESGTGDLILIGPSITNANINPNDDSVFELEFVEGYKGWDGDCGFGTQRSRMRFTKQ